MSNIYENGIDTKATKRKESKKNSQSVDTTKILNNKDLTDFTRNVTKFTGTAREVIYDDSEAIIGVLQKDSTPYLFSDKEQKDFSSKYKE